MTFRKLCNDALHPDNAAMHHARMIGAGWCLRARSAGATVKHAHLGRIGIDPIGHPVIALAGRDCDGDRFAFPQPVMAKDGAECQCAMSSAGLLSASRKCRVM